MRRNVLTFSVVGLILLGVVFAALSLRHFKRDISPSAQKDLSLVVSDPSTLYVEPEAGLDWLYARVNGAEKTIDVVMYELVDDTFTADLVAACKRGVQVRVILDGRLERSRNTPAFEQIAAAGSNCQAVWSQAQFPATHQKSVVVDSNTAVVMSLNLTSRYYAGTRDMALVDTDEADVSGMVTAFNKDFKPRPTAGFHVPVGHSLIWSPDTAQDDLVSLIEGVQHTLLVENEELSAPAIVQELAKACQRGVQVSVAMTDTNPAYHANYSALQAAGCAVHVGANNEKTLYIHAKALVADLGTATALGYMGSINFSEASLTQNRELGLYVRDKSVLAKMAAVMSGDFNAFPAFNPKTETAAARPALP